ncbi:MULTISPECIES: VIT1/CCC1 family protein [Anaeromyxobacter]|uniref:VIT1/CCC1 transporter family protein n=1 Tax=Anaeromyxobacter TaxID=161492 RepID=UPI001F55B965|nr:MULTISPECIES: VIT1/CCC1 family protein [unclassified Anaeromyxobacter]
MTAPRTDLWLQNLLDERDGAALYEGLARHEKDPARAQSFRELAIAERRHAELWLRKLEREGVAVPPDRPSSRVRALVWLARRLGSAAVVPMVLETEAGDADKYDRQGGEARAIAEEERAHRQALVGMSEGAPTDAREIIASRERWHRAGRSAGSLRAAVFGMNDGLVSNLSLILGVAGAGVAPGTVVITGFAGLLAGAFSMAAGEFTSVASQRDLLLRQVELEKREIVEAPEEEAAELTLIFKQKGLSTEQASRTAAELLKNPDSAADTLVREELGLDPEDLGSPMHAAVASFVLFSLGALVPVLPFLFTTGTPAVAIASALAGGLLAAVGGLLGFLSGTSVFRSAARMVGLAAVAAGVTYAVGRLFGATVS